MGFAFLYLVLGGAWIYLSDAVLLFLGASPESITRYQALKGAAYVVATALLAYCYLAKTPGRPRKGRVLQTVRLCSQAQVRAPDEATLLGDICRILVEHGGYRMAWAGFAEHDDAKSVRPVAEAGFETGRLIAASLSWADTGRGSGPIGAAIRTGQPVIARNITADPAFGPWRESLMQCGCASLMALPLKRVGCAFGALTVCAAETDAFDAEESGLLSGLADDLSFGITALRTRAENARAEEARRTTYQLLESIVEFLPDATFVIDQDKRVIAWNHACETMTGVKKEAVLGLGDYAYAEPFFGERRPMLIDLLDLPSPEVEATYKHVRRVGDTVYAESFIPRLLGGQGAHLRGAARMLFDREGRRCGAIEINRDVTDERRVERALHESELKHRTLFETAGDAILLIRGNRFIDCNARTLAMFGCSREQILGARPFEVSPPTQPDGRRPDEGVPEKINQALLGMPQLFEWELYRWDKTRFTAEVSLKSLELGGEVLLQAIVRDISERKRAVEDLRRLNAELEQRVIERTADLAAAKERAESADRLKSAFLATMSHELRTPLNSIIGFTGIVLQGLPGPLNAEQSKQLGMVQESARLLLDLINDILDLSKIEAGQLEIEAKPFDVRESVEKVARSAAPLAEKKKVTLTIGLSPDVGKLTGDRRRFEQILINLLNNALKFSEKGQVRVECAVNGRALVTRVADTGIGIRPEDMGKLFRSFQQIDSGLSRAHEGSGLGLSICKKLVEMQGGEISVESAWGVGSTFTFTLPLGK